MAVIPGVWGSLVLLSIKILSADPLILKGIRTGNVVFDVLHITLFL